MSFLFYYYCKERIVEFATAHYYDLSRNESLLHQDIKLKFSFLDRNTLPLDRRHHVFHNGTLLINKVTRKDTGTYACAATGRQGASASQSGRPSSNPPSAKPLPLRMSIA